MLIGFSYYSPELIASYLEAAGVPCAVVSSALEAMTARGTVRVLLWERARSFAFIDYSLFDDVHHIFFGSYPYLSGIGADVLDLNKTPVADVLGSLLVLIQTRSPKLSSDTISFLSNIPPLPESQFSREVRKTQGKKKKDTDPIFVAGAPLRQGIKEILDMCGHSREPATHYSILRYLLLADAGNQPIVLSDDLASLSKVKSFQEADAVCSSRLVTELLAIVPPTAPSLVDGGPSIEDRLRLAVSQLSTWLKSPLAVPVIRAFLLVLAGTSEIRAAYDTRCDVSSLSLLCRNLPLIRAQVIQHDLAFKWAT